MAFRTEPAPVTLRGALVELRPLERGDLAELLDAVSEGDLWKRSWYTSIPAPQEMEAEIEHRLDLAAKGQMIPFTSVDATGRILGMTTFYDLVPEVPRVHIGYTWNRPSAHGSGTNAESKLLMLEHAFEVLGAIRVGLTTQWQNRQSRAAIERLGAKQDGVMRAISRRNGVLIDSVEYSIVESEWPAVRKSLEVRLEGRR